MPTRWLSIRKRNPIQNDSDPQATAKQPDFDFAFGEQPSITPGALPRVGPRLVQLRPTTSGGTTGKRKLRVEVPSKRPQTTENHKPSPLQHLNGLSRSDDSYIGLAFGSPSHPPAGFGSHHEAGSPIGQNPFARHHQSARTTVSQMQSKRWKKFGTLFKQRNGVRRGDITPGPTIGLPTGLVVLDKEPLGEVVVEKPRVGQDDERPPPPVAKNDKPLLKAENLPTYGPGDDPISRPSTANATDAGSEEPNGKPPVPKLELSIPRNLDAAKRSSSLLARRSKTLESLKSTEDSRPTTKGTVDADSSNGSKPNSKPLTPVMPPRRLTTPTMTRPLAAKGYSLFPTTSPAPVKFVGRVPSSENENLTTGHLKRSATSPARLSPMQDQFLNTPNHEALNAKRSDSIEQMQSPEDNTASTDRSAPWSSAHSFQSSVSSATTVDEIFFDIKSFRDSQGVEDGQFVMTRPDSTQVELARTRSKRTPASSRLRQVEASPEIGSDQTTPVPPEPVSTPSDGLSGPTTKHTSVNTAYFDEAIADIERLTTPTGNIPSIEAMPSIPTVTIAHHDGKTIQPISLSRTHPSKPADLHVRLNSKSHEEVSRLIPSPVAEVKEDDSPRPDASSAKSPSSQYSQQIEVAKVISPRIAAVKRVDRPCQDSPTIPQGPPSVKPMPNPPSPSDDKPPPVPKKDAKFIPMSKYAPKGTASAIEQRAGVIPRRPVRANTEDLAVRTASTRVSKERSATLPSSLQPQSHQSPQSSSLRGLEKAVPPRPNPVALNPVGSAEVAIARTVSLARKQSARVHVPGPRLAARRADAQAQSKLPPQIQRQPSSAAHYRNTSTTSQKSNKSAKSILGHRHKRTTSSAKSALRGTSSNDASSKTKVTKEAASSFGKFMWTKESEKQLIKEAQKWEILEKKSYSPIVVQAERGHRPGLSVGLVVERA
ncbi:hypothetical protein H2200_008067 [Cladophialophora chaetospira]|uniref:Uncharacterized protein n=1 Tax=Cladophialophora chaetospira TaxID=386627 RepID=A0AA38X7G6_9EURO|nr:hypothetical protein H2200_008067 [Cladophialophora chaetospira]